MTADTHRYRPLLVSSSRSSVYHLTGCFGSILLKNSC
jgi:hypothetical protein